MRILIVEDDEETRLELVDSLQKSGYEVDSVGNGVQAMNIIKNTKYDFVLSDINMPKIGGLELAESLLGDPPMILYTSGYEVTGMRDLAKRFGVDIFMTNATIPNLLKIAMDTFKLKVQDNTDITSRLLNSR